MLAVARDVSSEFREQNYAFFRASLDWSFSRIAKQIIKFAESPDNVLRAYRNRIAVLTGQVELSRNLKTVEEARRVFAHPGLT